MDVRNAPSGAGYRIRLVAREHALYLSMIALYVATAVLVAKRAGPQQVIDFQLYSRSLFTMLGATAACLIVTYLLHLLLVKRPDYPLRHVRHELGSKLRLTERFCSGIPLMLGLSLFISVFSSWKFMIPDLQPFSWDPVFAEWDRRLHGGIAPWQWLQPVLGYPWITSSINFVYNCWLLLLYFVLIWQAFSLRNPTLRIQFYVTFFLSWGLIGSVLATLLSSAGPCYFGRVTLLDDPFLPLMNYLRQASEQVPLWSLAVQEDLWRAYSDRALEIGRGISAMPSMHISSSLLMVLLARRVHPRLGWAFSIFLGLIIIGSVHLGWHYAIDGYVSLVLTLVLWKLAGFIARHRCLQPRT